MLRCLNWTASAREPLEETDGIQSGVEGPEGRSVRLPATSRQGGRESSDLGQGLGAGRAERGARRSRPLAGRRSHSRGRTGPCCHRLRSPRGDLCRRDGNKLTAGAAGCEGAAAQWV